MGDRRGPAMNSRTRREPGTDKAEHKVEREAAAAPYSAPSRSRLRWILPVGVRGSAAT